MLQSAWILYKTQSQKMVLVGWDLKAHLVPTPAMGRDDKHAHYFSNC